MYRRVLVLLRLRQGTGATDDVWSEAVSQAGAEVGELAGLSGEGGGGGGKAWPVMLFFAVIFGAPWLLWRLLSSFSGKKGEYVI